MAKTENAIESANSNCSEFAHYLVESVRALTAYAILSSLTGVSAETKGPSADGRRQPLRLGSGAVRSYLACQHRIILNHNQPRTNVAAPECDLALRCDGGIWYKACFRHTPHEQSNRQCHHHLHGGCGQNVGVSW